MSERKVNEGILIIVLTQVFFITLKLTETGQAAKWSWIKVFSPTWFPAAVGMVVLSFYLLFRALFPDKKKQVMYTSNRWQERLNEIHSAR